MQTPPSKRALSFGSPSPSRSSASPGESKKTVVVGYVLDTSVVMKGFYFYVQLQDSENNVVQIPVYNAKIHQTLSNFQASGDPVKLEVYQQEDGKLKVGSYSQVYPAYPREVCFSINSSLKESIQLEKASRTISVKDLRRINARINKEKFTLKGRVNLGPDEPCEIDTQYGTKMIKRDIEIEDVTGKIDLHLFTNRLGEVQHGSSYELTSLLLSDYGGSHVSTTRESTIKVIDSLKGLPPPVLKPSSRSTYTIDGFESFANERLFFYCKKCHKEIPIVDAQSQAEWITCPAFKCSARNKTKNLRVCGACDVNFAANNNENLWVAVLPRILAKILQADITDVKQITDAVENVGQCQITIERGVLEEIIFQKDNETVGGELNTTNAFGSGEKKVDDTSGSGEKKVDDTSGSGEKKVDNTSGSGEKKVDDTSGSGEKKVDTCSGEKKVDTSGSCEKKVDSFGPGEKKIDTSGSGEKKIDRSVSGDKKVDTCSGEKKVDTSSGSCEKKVDSFGSGEKKIDTSGSGRKKIDRSISGEKKVDTSGFCEKKVDTVQDSDKDLSGSGELSRNDINGKGRKVGQKHKNETLIEFEKNFGLDAG